MSGERPHADAVLAAAFDERFRLAPGWRRYVTAELRCTHSRHLLAVVLGTANGRWVACRYVRRGEHRPLGGWKAHWADEAPSLLGVSCVCHRGPHVWVSTPWLVDQAGTVTPAYSGFAADPERFPNRA